MPQLCCGCGCGFWNADAASKHGISGTGISGTVTGTLYQFTRGLPPV